MKTLVIAVVLHLILDSAKSEVKYFYLRAVDNFHKTLQNDSLVKPVTLVSGVTKLKCSIRCVDSKACVSFEYISANKVCRLFEGGLNTAKDFSPAVKGARRYMFNGGSIGHYCDNLTSCIVKNSECRSEGACGCEAGYSFQQSSHTCEKDCDTYGNTFQYFYQRHISGMNKEHVWETPVAQCAQRCIEATTYTCISFDRDLTECLLQSVDPSDDPLEYHSGSQWDFYQRNCA